MSHCDIIIVSNQNGYAVTRGENSTITIHTSNPQTIQFDEFPSLLKNMSTCHVAWVGSEIMSTTAKFQSMIRNSGALPDIPNTSIILNHMGENGAHPDFHTNNPKIQQKCRNYIISVLEMPVSMDKITVIYKEIRSETA